MLFKLILVKNDAKKSYDLTPVTTSISWDSNLSIASVMEFNTAWSDYKLYPKNPIELGDLIIISVDDTEVNRGIVVKSKKSDANNISYVVYDYGWYLGKSKSVYQFNNVSATQAITKILTDFGIPMGNITDMPNLINAIFVQKTPAEIINEIIKAYEHQYGFRVYSEFRQGKLYIEKMIDAVVIGQFRLAKNLTYSNVLDAPVGAEKTQSIEEMRNRIKIILSSDDNYETVALSEDTINISKYGLIEEVFKIEEEDVAKARQVAKILLNRLNKVHETDKIQLMGDVSFKAGRLFDVVETTTGINGQFMITQAKHMIDAGGYHTMDLTLSLPEDVA